MEELAKLMMFGAPDTVPPNTARIPSIVILGADALLAALPATPIQLAHACLRVGYQHVVPASWGDELIASATLRELHNRSHAPAIQCSCPFVANRLLAVGPDLRPFLISLLAPPVVLARYLRHAYGPRQVRLTYVGRCPGAADESIDARLTPEELLATFADHQIDVSVQPEAFDSVIPPDRRRFRSQPGGLPTPEMLWLANSNGGASRTLVELFGDELPVELAQHLLAGKPVLIDVASKLGCVCSGATGDGDPMQARARVTALEPPRAASPIVDEGVPIDAVLALPASPRSVIDVVAPSHSMPAPMIAEGQAPNAQAPLVMPRDDVPALRPDPQGNGPAGMGRRYSPARGVARLTSGGLPTARDADGRQLPRTYVARRRSPSRPATRTLEAEAPIPVARESVAAPAPSTSPLLPNDQNGSGRDAESSNGPRPTATVIDSPISRPAAAKGPSLAQSGQAVAPPNVGTPPAEPTETAPRFAERPIASGVTTRFDNRPREAAPSTAAPERPVMQLLTLGLLIAMVVLISAAVGLVAGRWMTQH